MNEEYEAEFERCEEMDALARSNRARAGSPAKDKPKSTGLKRTTPLRAKIGLQTKTPLKAKAGLAAHSIARPKAAQAGEFQPEAETSRDAGSKWNGLQRKTPLKAKSPMKATPSKRHYGHMVKNGWCACCGKGTLETEWHHIIYRSHGGDESDENMLEVCRECHEKIHAGKITKEEVAFARLTAGCYLEEQQRVIGAKA